MSATLEILLCLNENIWTTQIILGMVSAKNSLSLAEPIHRIINVQAGKLAIEYEPMGLRQW